MTNGFGSRKCITVGIVAALLAAACAGGDGAGSDDTTVITTAASEPATSSTSLPTTPPTVDATTVPNATTPPSTDPAGPIIEQRIVVTGPEEIVFDWTTDQCIPEHIPDIATRAFRNADGEVSLTIGHWDAYRMIGPSLDEVVTDCSAPLVSSDFDPDPAQFDDSEWIGSPYTLDGETIYAIVHNEYRGDTHGAARPDQCPSGQRLSCLDTSFTMHVSTDGGDTFDHIAPPPGHLVATLPYQYIDDSVPTGIRQPSNIIEGPDGLFYLFGNVSDHPDEQQWVCAMRTADLADPTSWRYWDGEDFAGQWRNPYLEPVDPNVDTCAPLAFGALSGGINEGVVFDERIDRYVMVGMSNAVGAGETVWGVYYSTSENLIDWTARRLLIDLAINPSVSDPDNDTVHAYPTIIDPDSSSLNFSTSDGEMYLYVSRFNAGGNSLDRDLIRFPIEVQDVEVMAPVWTFDTAGDAEGWVAEQGLTDLVVADGALAATSTTEDPVLNSPALTLPAAFDTLKIRMAVQPGASEVFAELFFITLDEPDVDGDKLITFEIIDDGDFHDYELDLSAFAEWQGTITRLRFDPVTVSDLAVAIDGISFVAR